MGCWSLAGEPQNATPPRMRVNLTEMGRVARGSGPAAAHRRQPKGAGVGRPLNREGARPRAPQRRAKLTELFRSRDRQTRSASGTIRQLPDGDAIPPSAGSRSRLYRSTACFRFRSRNESRPVAARAACQRHPELEPRRPPDGWSVPRQAWDERACRG